MSVLATDAFVSVLATFAFVSVLVTYAFVSVLATYAFVSVLDIDAFTSLLHTACFHVGFLVLSCRQLPIERQQSHNKRCFYKRYSLKENVRSYK